MSHNKQGLFHPTMPMSTEFWAGLHDRELLNFKRYCIMFVITMGLLIGIVSNVGVTGSNVMLFVCLGWMFGAGGQSWINVRYFAGQRDLMQRIYDIYMDNVQTSQEVSGELEAPGP